MSQSSRSSWTQTAKSNGQNTNHEAKMMRMGRERESAVTTRAKRIVSTRYNITMWELDQMSNPEIAEYIRQQIK